MQQTQHVKADAAYWRELNLSVECYLQIRGRVNNQPPYKLSAAVFQ